MRTLGFGALLVLACALALRVASATVVTIDFTGNVENVYDEGLLDGSVSIGTPFHVRVVYDDAASPEYADAGNRTATWSFSTPPFECSMTVGNYSMIPGPDYAGDSGPSDFHVQLAEGGGADDYNIAASGARVLSGVLGGALPVRSGFYASLHSSPGTALDDYLDLASVPLILGAWANNEYSPVIGAEFYQLTASDEDPPGLYASIGGRIAALEYSVPEPPASATAIAFLLASFMIRRRCA